VLARAWPQVEPILKRATDRVTGYEPIDLLRLTMSGHMSMWLVCDYTDAPVAVAVTQLKEYPRLRVLEVPFIAGSGLRHWHRQLLRVLDEQARALGCADIMGFDRKGWRHFGFAACGIVLVRHVAPAIGEVSGHG
jgi:hypothetical protein